jgi:hypothetical protein
VPAQDCIATGKLPQKLNELIQESKNYGPPPRVDKNGNVTLKYFTPNRLNLCGYPEATIDSLQSFIEKFESFVPDVFEVISDGFTDEQKYLIQEHKGFFRWVSLGLFHKIFGGVPDFLNHENCPLKKGSMKDGVLLIVETQFAFFKLIEAGEKYIRECSKKYEKDYIFDSPLELFFETCRTDGENIFNSILVGSEDYTSRKKILKARATIKKYVKGNIEQEKSLQISGDPRYMDWRALIVLALAPLYASREEEHFKNLWDKYFGAVDELNKFQSKKPSFVIDPNASFYMVGPNNKHQKHHFCWQDNKLSLKPEL